MSWNSRLRPWAREARPLCGYNPSPAVGITHVSYGRAGMTLRGSLCSPSRTRLAEASQTEAVVWKGKVEGESCSPHFTCFSCVRLLTPWCDAELGREASRAAEATRVEVQRLKEKAEASRVEAQRWKEKAEASQVKARCWG